MAGRAPYQTQRCPGSATRIEPQRTGGQYLLGLTDHPSPPWCWLWLDVRPTPRKLAGEFCLKTVELTAGENFKLLLDLKAREAGYLPVNFRHLMSRRKNPDRAVSERWILLKGDQPIMSREKKTSFKLGSGRFVHKMPYKISSKMEPGNYTLRLRFELTGKYRDS